MKVLIGQKNSRWKVVQNPLKGNYYTDVMDFESEADKDTFLNANFYNGWKNFNDPNYIETPITWTDEIHGSFTIDLESTQFTRHDALRKDFAVFYDETEKSHSFYTLEASLPPKQVYTTVTFNFELDVFFNYGVKNLWKNQAQVSLQRGVFANQWKQDALGNNLPNAALGSLITLAEDIQTTPVLTDSQMLNDEPLKGYIVYVRPQRRTVQNYPLKQPNGTTLKYSGQIEDTIILGANSSNGPTATITSEIMLILNTQEADRPLYSASEGVCVSYPEGQKVDGSKKSMAFIKLWWDVRSLYYKDIANLLNSPDVIRIEPSNVTPKITQTVEGVLIGQNDYAYEITTPDSETLFSFRSTIPPTQYNSLSIIRESSNTYTASYTDPATNESNYMTSAAYHPEQYAKLQLGLHRSLKLFNGKGQSMTVFYENVQDYFFHLNRKRVSTPQASSSLTTIDSGIYEQGNLYNPFAWQEDLTINRWQTSDMWLEYISQNGQSLNQAARQQNIDYAYQKELNRIEGIQSNASAADIPIGSVFDTIKGLLGGNITGGAKRVLDWETQATTADYNRAMLKNAINTQAASIADAQSARGQTRDTGGDYERLRILANPFAVNVQVWETTGQHKRSIADYYHRYGYQTAGTLVNPQDWLNNGIYWDYFQATFDSVYQALNESVSPQEAKIIALSVDQGIRIWHWKPNLPSTWEVGNYNFRNIQS